MAISIQPGRRARLKDIAATVGLSVNTVSRALAGKDAVSEHTRALIQAEAFKHLMPRAIESYSAGGTLHFGKLSINQAGIDNGKEVVPWAQVKSVQVSNGFIVIKKDGKWLNWANVAVAQTPNFFVFLALVDQNVGVKG